MTSSQLMEKAMRDTQVRDFLTYWIHNLMLSDFQATLGSLSNCGDNATS